MENTFATDEMDKLREHLLACSQCRDAFQDSVLLRGVWVSNEAAFTPTQELLDAGKQVTSGAGVPEGKEPFGAQKRPGILGFRRFSIVTACAAILLIAAILLMRPSEIGRVGKTALDFAALQPLRSAVETFSKRGLFVLPGGEHSLDETGTAYRSGFVPLSDPLESSFRQFHRAFQDGNSTPELVYWLIGGYVATGQVDAARDIVSHPRVLRLKDARITILRAIVAFMDDNYDQSEVLLRDVLDENPKHPIASINLAIVLHERGNDEESSAILNRIGTDHAGTPLARRAQAILSSF
jgi:hypothetical protein